MKLSLAAIALSASAAAAYNVGGFDTFGRPFLVSPRGRFRRQFRSAPGCAPGQGGGDCTTLDRAFEELRNELKNDRSRRQNPSAGRGPPIGKMDEDTIRQQQEWVSRAFGLANDVAKGLAATPDEAKEANEAVRQQKEWVDRAFGFAREVSSGGTYSSVNSEVIQDDDEAFQVALDVPGVKVADIDVSLEGTKDKILIVRGKRDVGGKEEQARKFSKVMALDPRSDTDQLSADLENGVLVVTVPRVAIENVASIQKVPVNKVSEESLSSEETQTFPFELEIDFPGVSAENIDLQVEGDTDKTLTITAVRELGKDSEGNPRKKETTKSFNVDELVDTSKIVANLSNGVLKVSAPADQEKAKETVRKVAVKQSPSADSSRTVETPDTSSSNETDSEDQVVVKQSPSADSSSSAETPDTSWSDETDSEEMADPTFDDEKAL